MKNPGTDACVQVMTENDIFNVHKTYNRYWICKSGMDGSRGDFGQSSWRNDHVPIQRIFLKYLPLLAIIEMLLYNFINPWKYDVFR